MMNTKEEDQTTHPYKAARFPIQQKQHLSAFVKVKITQCYFLELHCLLAFTPIAASDLR